VFQGCIKFRIPPPPPGWNYIKTNWEAFQKGRKEGKKKRVKGKEEEKGRKGGGRRNGRKKDKGQKNRCMVGKKREMENKRI